MAKSLQIKKLKEIFSRLNPEISVETIDWEMETDETLSFPENRLDLAAKFPLHKWFKNIAEETGTRKDAEAKLAEEISYLEFASEQLPEESRVTVYNIIDAFSKRIETIKRIRKRVTDLRRDIEEKKQELKTLRAKPTPAVEREIKVLWHDFHSNLRALGIVDPDKYRSTFEATVDRTLSFAENERAIAEKVKEIMRIEEVSPVKIPKFRVEPLRKEEKPRVERITDEAPAFIVGVPAITPPIREPTKEELKAEAERREARKLGIPLIKYKELKKVEALPTDEDKVMNLHLARFSEEYISQDVGIPLEDVKHIIQEHEIKSLHLGGTPVERIVEDTGLTTEQVKAIVEKKGYYG